MTNQRLIMLIFFLQPIAFGAWLPRIPDVQQRLGLGPAELAVALLGMPLGILLTLPFAGRFVAWIGGRATILYGFVVFLALVWLPTWASSIEGLFVTLAIVGVALATLELGLNVEADAIEKHSGQLIMSTCHGFWSLGIMTGSLIGVGFAALRVAPEWAVPLTAALMLPISVFFASKLPRLQTGETAAAETAPSRRRLPSLALLGVCFFVFGITMTEGAVADWSAVFLRDVFGLSAASAGFGYSIFAFMVAAGRFAGDRLKASYGPVAVARACSIASVTGLVLVVISPAAWAALAGFAAMGFGVSVGFPLAVTAAADQKDRPAAASVAILSFIALLGFLLGPPLIGLVAEHSDMRFGLSVLVPFLVISLLLTGRLKPAARVTVQDAQRAASRA
ncbi:MFS transporter [Ensifer sesbaniae]|uniref:MFS transporter n=1 Tax=Ensifer sesbaniae TaxID=1214071 RepID=UPI00156800C3|nr:MFS transporter [Ensifer sesbaniae]MCK3777073.1 MFS transporter [Ensifer sesbaniae]NRQ17176.1 Inner membrane protein YbjJ [Ensifer sesbaniae]